MKWLTHEVVTGVIVYAATDDPMAAVYSMAGAIIPDKVEGNPFKRHLSHRGWSHWPLLYILLAWVFASGKEYLGLDFGTLKEIGFFMAIGALLHIAEDVLCGKVPWLTPYHKIGVRLFKVGSVGEYLTALVLVLGAYGLKIAFG